MSKTTAGTELLTTELWLAKAAAFLNA